MRPATGPRLRSSCVEPPRLGRMPGFATRLVAAAAAVAVTFGAVDPASAIETEAREAILIDYDTRQVLFEKNPDQPMPPSSMTKLMTVFLAFERLKDGRLKMTDEIPISETAWRMGGSKMFVPVGGRVSVSDILHGIIVQSGNDATVALAERSEEHTSELQSLMRNSYAVFC